MPSADSPFAEFAAPKLSAVEYLRARQEQDRQASRGRWLFFGVLAATVAIASTGGATAGAGIKALPAALALAIAGTLAGLLLGWLIGMVGWALIYLRTGGAFGLAGAHLVRGNSWDVMTVWLSGCGAIGIACGAASGAGWGARLAGPAPPEALIWSWAGALAGLPAGLLLWLLARRLARRPQEGLRLQKLADAATLEPDGPAAGLEPLAGDLAALSAGGIDTPQLLRKRKSNRSWVLASCLIAFFSALLVGCLGLMAYVITAPFAQLEDRRAAYSHGTLAIDLCDQGKFAAALAEINLAIELAPDDPELYNARGVIHHSKGDLPSAIADYSQAIELDPRFGTGYLNRGYARADNGIPDGAIADFTKAIELNPAFRAELEEQIQLAKELRAKQP